MYTIKKLGDGKESGSGEKGTRCQERKRKKFFESDYQARSQEIKKSIYFIRFLDIGPVFRCPARFDRALLWSTRFPRRFCPARFPVPIANTV